MMELKLYVWGVMTVVVVSFLIWLVYILKTFAEEYYGLNENDSISKKVFFIPAKLFQTATWKSLGEMFVVLLLVAPIIVERFFLRLKKKYIK
jgi:hypothetical protein